MKRNDLLKGTDMNILKPAAGTVLTASLLCNAAELIPGKLFELDFANADGSAKFAKGKAAPVTEYVTPDLEGIGGKAYRVTKDGRQLRYCLTGNADVRQGTANIWVNTVNYDVSDRARNSFWTKPVNLFTLHFAAGKEWAEATCCFSRKEDGAGIRFDFDASIPPNRFGGCESTAADLKLLKVNTWHLVTCTWDRDHIGVWVDGKFQGKSLRSDKLAFIDSLTFDKEGGNSGIMIRGDGTEQSVTEFGEVTDVAGFSIYDRVLAPTEIHLLYAAGKKLEQSEADLVVTTCQGTFRGGKEYVKCDMDLTLLRRLNKDFAGDCTIACEVADSKGVKRFADSVKIGKTARPELLFSGLSPADHYTVRFELAAENGKKLSFERGFDKPDTSWCESKAGMEDTTPEPWTPPVLGKDDSVTVWNRVYTFDGGPFPANVTAGGKAMLAKAPRLILAAEKGELVPAGKITRRTQGGSFVKLNGELSAPDGFAADFETTVDFDGFVQVDLKLKRPYPVKSMRVEWQVAKEFAEHFLTPKVDSGENPVINYKYTEPKCLYFASEKGGFAFGKTGDANWVYDPSAVAFTVNKATKETVLRVISKPVVIPEDADYRFCFIATPTHPLMKNARSWRFSDRSGAPGSVMLRYHMYQGDGNLLISPTELKKAAKGKRNLQLYSAASFLTPVNPEAKWFYDEWLMYAIQYSMRNGISIPSCLNSSKANFLAENTRKSLDIPEFELVDGYYFDCCGVPTCGNKLHGCGRTDKFGREVKTVVLLPMRSHLKRIARLLHGRGRTFGAHGQFSFNPCAHSLCDYWLTGEEIRSFVKENGAQVYCDPEKVTDLHLRTNSNYRVFCNVVMCMLYYNKDTESCIPALTRLLLEDQKVFGSHTEETQQRMDIVWKVFAEFNVDEGTVHRFFEQQDIVADNPELRVTYYRMPGDRIVAVVGNINSKKVSGKIDFGKVKKGEFAVRDEIAGLERPAENGKVAVELAPMDFTLLTIR